MKIFIPVLTLFSASMALGSTLDKCKSELKEYSGCIFDYTKISSSKLNQYCNTFYSSKCQNYINKPEKYVPSCFSLDNSYRIDDLILLNYKKALLDLICQNDSQGNRCSISEIFFGKDVKSSSNVKKIIEATCKQSNCRNKYIEFLDAKYKLGNSGDKNKYEISSINLSNISQMKKYMQSNECVGKGSSTTTKVNKTTSRNIPISTVKGRCGPAYGACSVEGECCSKHNYCGTSTEHCGTGCQIGYGICSSSNLSPNTTPTTTTKKATTTKNKTTIKSSTTTLRSVSTVSGRCGPEYGACAKADQCCSKYGYCGTSSAHCGTGCQIGYGICSSSKLSPTTTTTTKKATITKNKTTIKGSTTTIKKSTTTLRSVSTVSGRCGPEYGACAKADQCCSKYGYCGTSSAHCDIGCQIGYGKCNKTSNEAAKTTKKTSTKITSTKKTSTKKTSTKMTSTKKTSTKKTSTKKTSTKKITNKTTSTKRAIATVSGRCGIKYGGACAEAGLCCSKYDYCGSSSAHCGVVCKSAFGVCK